MQPGKACIACHATEPDAPTFLIAGTVYPTLHAVDLCNGSSNVTVEITGADGAKKTLTTNKAGNFYWEAPPSALKLPFKAKVISANGEAQMFGAQNSGDCNSCHTVQGNGPSGRIFAP